MKLVKQIAPVILGGLMITSFGMSSVQAKTITVSGSGIQSAINAAVAGDVVVVNAGVYHEKISIVNKSGITIKAQGTVVLEGTGLTIPSGDSQMVLIKNSSNIVFQGFSVANYKTASSSAFNKGIQVEGSGSNITISNNKIYGIENTSSKSGAHGIGIYGNSSTTSINNLVIDNNEVYNCKLGASESIVLNGNVEKFKVTNNHVHDNNNIGIDFIGYEGIATGEVDRARDGECSGNYVHNITTKGNKAYKSRDLCADGIYVDGGTRIVIKNNRVEHCDLGIEFTSEHKNKDASYITVTGNTVSSNITGISLGGYDAQRGKTQSCTVQNNTIQNNTNCQIQLQYYCYNNTITGNTIIGTTPFNYVKASTCSGNIVTPHNIK